MNVEWGGAHLVQLLHCVYVSEYEYRCVQY